MRFPAFPPHWDYRRVNEIIIAAYASTVGFIFWVWPRALEAPHYARLGGIEGARNLGAAFMVAAFLHAFALWLNGSAPRCSRSIRLTACIFHATLVSIIGIQLTLEGIIFGSVTLGLVLVMIYFAMHRAFNP